MVRGSAYACLGGEDEVGPVVVLALHEQQDEADGLDGFAQAHLVGQDACTTDSLEKGCGVDRESAVAW